VVILRSEQSERSQDLNFTLFKWGPEVRPLAFLRMTTMLRSAIVIKKGHPEMAFDFVKVKLRQPGSF
jgi:hypothetical protein